MGPSLVLSTTTTMAEWNRGNKITPYNNRSSSNEEEEEDRYPRDEVSTTMRWSVGENPYVPHRSAQEDTSLPFAGSTSRTQSDPNLFQNRHAVPFSYTGAMYDASAGSPVGPSFMRQEYTMSPFYSSAARPSEERRINMNVAVAASKNQGKRDDSHDDDDRKPAAVRLPRDDMPRNLSPLPTGNVHQSPHQTRHSISANPFRSVPRSPSHHRGEMLPTQDRFINPMFSFDDEVGPFDLPQAWNTNTSDIAASHTLHPDFIPSPPFDQGPISFRLGGDSCRLTSRTITSTELPASSVTEISPAVTESVTTLSVATLPHHPQIDLRRRTASPSELEAAETERARNAIVTWYERFNELIDYRKVCGDCNVPQKYQANPKLGIWVNKQRMEKKFMDEGKRSSMTPRKVRALESIGFTWAKRKGEASWMYKYNELQLFLQQFGTCDVPTKYAPNPALGRWVSTQRSEYKMFMQRDGRSRHLTQDKIDMLNSLGFKWEMILTRFSSTSSDGSGSTTRRAGLHGSD